MIEHIDAFDRHETLPAQFEMLSAAGFQHADCVWRSWNYGVFVAGRAA